MGADPVIPLPTGCGTSSDGAPVVSDPVKRQLKARLIFETGIQPPPLSAGSAFEMPTPPPPGSRTVGRDRPHRRPPVGVTGQGRIRHAQPIRAALHPRFRSDAVVVPMPPVSHLPRAHPVVDVQLQAGHIDPFLLHLPVLGAESGLEPALGHALPGRREGHSAPSPHLGAEPERGQGAVLRSVIPFGPLRTPI